MGSLTIDADPQFLFPAPWRRPSILTLILEAGNDFIEPKLYFDWGDGFHEFELVKLGSVQTAVICLHFGDTRGLRKIRLDPAEGRVATFRFRSVLNTEGDGALDWAQRHVEAAYAKGRVASLQNIDMQEYATPARGRPIGMKRRPRNTQEHFMRTVEIARMAFGAGLHSADNAQPSSPLISLVTSVYNTPPKYLDDLLYSFQMQEPGLAELILSDDGSTSPSTCSWLERNKAVTGLIILRSSENKAIAAAANSGVKASHGRWVGFIDHDDALAPFALATLAKVISENPEVKFIYTDELIADVKLRGL